MDIAYGLKAIFVSDTVHVMQFRSYIILLLRHLDVVSQILHVIVKRYSLRYNVILNTFRFFSVFLIVHSHSLHLCSKPVVATKCPFRADFWSDAYCPSHYRSTLGGRPPSARVTLCLRSVPISEIWRNRPSVKLLLKH